MAARLKKKTTTTTTTCKPRTASAYGRAVRYRSWEGPRTWFSCKMAAVRDAVQHLIARLSEEILADEDGIDYLCTHIDRLLNLLKFGSVQI